MLEKVNCAHNKVVQKYREEEDTKKKKKQKQKKKDEEEVQEEEERKKRRKEERKKERKKEKKQRNKCTLQASVNTRIKNRKNTELVQKIHSLLAALVWLHFDLK